MIMIIIILFVQSGFLSTRILHTAKNSIIEEGKPDDEELFKTHSKQTKKQDPGFNGTANIFTNLWM
jgi:hypothetical protein